MNKDELVGYIQGLLDMSKKAELLMDHDYYVQEMESKLLILINKAIEKHKDKLKEEYVSINDLPYFNKKADEYATPKEKEDVDPIWNGPSEDLLPDKGPQISSHGEFGKKK